MDGEAQQLVPRGVELDLVDAVPEAVVGAEDGRVRVGEATPDHRLTAGLDAEALQAVPCPAGAVSVERVGEDTVAREEGVPLGGGGRTPPAPQTRRGPGPLPGAPAAVHRISLWMPVSSGTPRWAPPAACSV